MKKTIVIFLFSCCSSMAVFAQSPYIPSQSNTKNRQWFEKARLGLFIHFCVYTHVNFIDSMKVVNKVN
jgi:alpha-L-fucosidase